MKRILVPVDASQASLEGLETALQIQNAFAAELTLLHVIADDWLSSGYRLLHQDDRPVFHEAKALLEGLRKRCPLTVTTELLIAEGNTVETIREIALDGQYDFVVLGTQGMDALWRQWFKNSITCCVLETLPIPVVVVKQRGRTEMKHILIPVDGSQAAMRAVEQGVMMQKAFGAKVTLAYVVADPRKEGVVEGYEATLRMEDDMEKSGQNILDVACECFPPDVSVDRLMLKGAVAHSLEQVIRNGAYDFIIMGTEGMGSALKRLIMGSVTKHVIQHIDVPVLVVR